MKPLYNGHPVAEKRTFHSVEKTKDVVKLLYENLYTADTPYNGRGFARFAGVRYSS